MNNKSWISIYNPKRPEDLIGNEKAIQRLKDWTKNIWLRSYNFTNMQTDKNQIFINSRIYIEPAIRDQPLNIGEKILELNFESIGFGNINLNTIDLISLLDWATTEYSLVQKINQININIDNNNFYHSIQTNKKFFEWPIELTQRQWTKWIKDRWFDGKPPSSRKLTTSDFSNDRFKVPFMGRKNARDIHLLDLEPGEILLILPILLQVETFNYEINKKPRKKIKARAKKISPSQIMTAIIKQIDLVKYWINNWSEKDNTSSYQIIDKIYNVIINYHQYYKKIKLDDNHVALFVSGTNGCGRFAAVKVILEEYFDLIILNAHEERCKNAIEIEFAKINNGTSLLSNINKDKSNKNNPNNPNNPNNSNNQNNQNNKMKFTLLIIKQVDAMTTGDKGGLGCLYDTISKNLKSDWAVPIVCISNNSNNKKLNDIRKICDDIVFTKPNKSDLKQLAIKVVNEQFKPLKTMNLNDEEMNNFINSIVNKTASDFRQLLLHLQSTYQWALDQENINYQNINEFLESLNYKKDSVSMYDTANSLFKEDWVFDKMQGMDRSMIPNIFSENYIDLFTKLDNKITEKESKMRMLEVLSKTSRNITIANTISKDIYTHVGSCLPDAYGILSVASPIYNIKSELYSLPLHNKPPNNNPTNNPNETLHNNPNNNIENKNATNNLDLVYIDDREMKFTSNLGRSSIINARTKRLNELLHLLMKKRADVNIINLNMIRERSLKDLSKFTMDDEVSEDRGISLLKYYNFKMNDFDNLLKMETLGGKKRWSQRQKSIIKKILKGERSALSE